MVEILEINFKIKLKFQVM